VSIARARLDLLMPGSCRRWSCRTLGPRCALAWVKPRTRTVTFDLPPINTAANGEAALGAILAACGAGKLTPDEAKKLSVTANSSIAFLIAVYSSGAST
jgi:hypothetical protein